MLFVDAADREHGHEDLHVGDQRGVAREQRFDRIRPVGDDDEVDPRARNVDARQFLLETIDLRDDDAVAEGRRFDDQRRLLGIRAGIQITVGVGRVRRDERDVGRQIDEVAREQFEVGVDGPDRDAPVIDHLREAQALRPGEREIDAARDAALEQVHVFGSAEHGQQQVQVVHALGIDFGELARKEIGLLLVVAFEHDAVAGFEEGVECVDEPLRVEHAPIRECADAREALALPVAPCRPVSRRRCGRAHRYFGFRAARRDFSASTRCMSLMCCASSSAVSNRWCDSMAVARRRLRCSTASSSS